MYYDRRSPRRRRRRILWHRVALLLLLPVLLVAGIVFLVKCTGKTKDPQNGSVSAGSSFVFASSAGPEVSSAASLSSAASSAGVSSRAAASAFAQTSSVNVEAELSAWYLRLVNAKNPLPQNFVPALTDINPSYCRDPNFRFDSRAVEKLNAMCAAAKTDGVKLLVISPYRSISKQTELFAAAVAKYPNLSKEEAEAKAAESTARPGMSEHNLGLAADLTSLQTSFENTAQFRWLSKHAADYGFILRYPKDKFSVTGVKYEPWHYRYVGEYHAQQIKAKGVCLEEYIDYLKTQR